MNATVHVISGGNLREAVSTPGLRRRVAFDGDEYWFGHVEAAPDALSGWHHHGDTLTIGYVLSGTFRFEHGPGGRDSAEVATGDYFTVPPHLVHREGNSTNEPAEVVLVRIGPGPPVVPVDGPDPG